MAGTILLWYLTRHSNSTYNLTGGGAEQADPERRPGQPARLPGPPGEKRLLGEQSQPAAHRPPGSRGQRHGPPASLRPQPGPGGGALRLVVSPTLLGPQQRQVGGDGPAGLPGV